MSPMLHNLFSGPKRRYVAVAVSVLLVGGVYLWIRSRSAAAAEFITEPVAHGSIRNVVNATGTVQAVLTVQVGSQVSGQLESIYADFNSIVKNGQVLAKLDARRYQAAVTQAQANLQAAQSHVATAQADLNSTIANRASSQANLEAAKVARDNTAQILARYDALAKQGILSQNDYDTAKANADSAAAKYNQAKAQLDQMDAQINSSRAGVEQAKAQVEQSQASLRQAQIDLEYTTITSPVDGVVVSRNVDVGQTVAASLSAPTLFIIANDLTKMQVNASVDEADIGNITDAENVQFTVDAYPNRTFIGHIAEVRLEPSTTQNVTTYSVIISVDNERLELKPGMTANITFTVARQDNVVKIPNAAVRYLPPGVTREDVADMLQKAAPAGGPTGTAPAEQTKGTSAPEQTAMADSTPARAAADQQKTPLQAQETTPAPSRGDRGGAWSGGGDAGQQGGRGRRGGMRGNGGAADWTGNGRAAGAAPQAPRTPQDTSKSAALAPGQLWNPNDKIQFPRQLKRSTRPAIVWVLASNKKPEARHVVLGITDGRETQVVSGDLKDTDQIIVSDSSQAATAPTQQQGRGGFGGGPGGGGGGFIFGGRGGR
jgi:HlyD family secretion protein